MSENNQEQTSKTSQEKRPRGAGVLTRAMHDYMSSPRGGSGGYRSGGRVYNPLQPVAVPAPINRNPKQRAANVTPSPPVASNFRSEEIRSSALEVLRERLQDVHYDAIECKNLSRELAGALIESCKDLTSPKYKLVVVVSLGSIKEQPGMQFGSRCLWNKETDHFESIKFMNDSIFAVAMVYGLYFD